MIPWTGQRPRKADRLGPHPRQAADPAPTRVCAPLCQEVWIRKDIRLFARLLDRGCTLGSARACHDLATAYEYGTEAFAQDQTRAFELHLKACNIDHVEASDPG